MGHQIIVTPIEHKLECGECGSPMVLRRSKFKSGVFYGCSTYPACTGTHSAHRSGKPHGVPANQETRRWRRQAHAAFDTMWSGDAAVLPRGNTAASPLHIVSNAACACLRQRRVS